MEFVGGPVDGRSPMTALLGGLFADLSMHLKATPYHPYPYTWHFGPSQFLETPAGPGKRRSLPERRLWKCAAL